MVMKVRIKILRPNDSSRLSVEFNEPYVTIGRDIPNDTERLVVNEKEWVRLVEQVAKAQAAARAAKFVAGPAPVPAQEGGAV